MEIEKKELKLNTPNSYLVLISILIFLGLILLIDNKNIYIIKGSSAINLALIRLTILIFSVISVIVLFIQYMGLKQESLYIAALFYFNFSIEMILKLAVTIIGETELSDIRFYYTMLIRGVFLIILIIYFTNKDKKILKNKILFTSIYCIFITIIILCSSLSIGADRTNFTIAYPITLLIDSFSLIMIAIVACRTKEVMYFTVLLSIMISITSNIYEIYFMTYNVDSLVRNNSIFQLILSSLSFLILLIGVLVQSFKFFKKGERIEKDNKKKINFIEGNIKEVILMVNEKFIIEYSSGNIKKFLGFEVNEIIGKKLVDIISKADREKHANDSLRASRDEETIEINFLDKFGEEKKAILKVKHFINGENITIILFISEYIENEVEKLKGELNEIKEIEEHKREFYGELSHELRTPVNIIYSSMQLLGNKKNLDDKEEFLKYYDKYEKVMRQNALIMLKLINNLIDNNKIEAGFTEVILKNYDIVSLIENITMLAIPYLEEKEISLIFDTEYEEHIIKCDPDKIERIMFNLLSNGAKYTGNKGKIEVLLEFDNDYVIIKVRDSGVGIPENMQKEIFEKFKQVEDRKEKKLGSGIGLALVKSLVELHNGKIELNSKLGEGSEFIVKIPNEIKVTLEDEVKVYNYASQSIANLSVEFSDL
ncbi:MAG: ATP-binding protein [Sarcina sp.]